MSIEKFYSQHTPICDHCEATLPGKPSFKEALQAMKDAGWESRKVDGKWIHVCPDCQFEEKGY